MLLWHAGGSFSDIVCFPGRLRIRFPSLEAEMQRWEITVNGTRTQILLCLRLLEVIANRGADLHPYYLYSVTP